MQDVAQNKDISFEDFKKEVLEDYKIAVTSRECSLLGRREVLTGKAKFGIFGDGKKKYLNSLGQNLLKTVISDPDITVTKHL